MRTQAKILIDVIGDIRNSLPSRVIGDIKGSRINPGRSWMGKTETKRNGVTTIYVIPREAEWIQNDTHYSQVIISLWTRQCSDWFDGRTDTEFKEMIDPIAGAGDAVVYSD